MTSEVVGGLDEVLGVDNCNKHTMDQRICIGLTFGAGWKTSVAITNDLMGKIAQLKVDYCNLPI